MLTQALDRAITASVDAGVVHAVAAGNNPQDAAGDSPGAHPDVISVSAMADSTAPRAAPAAP